MAAPVHDSLEDPNGLLDDYSTVKKRTNVLLLGDHIGDLGMSDGLNYENQIAVGFLLAKFPFLCFIHSLSDITLFKTTYFDSAHASYQQLLLLEVTRQQKD
jgi:hypothetical protein